MRPAIAIGTTLDGTRDEREVPWRASVEYGEVELGRWPTSATTLRGAVVAALGPQAHVDMHNHLEDGTTRQARATVLYRVSGGRGRVWAYGPRALDHLAAVARISALRLPSGSVVRVDEARLRTRTLEVGLHKAEWYAYDLRTPYFPSEVAYQRRPRGSDAEQAAWAGQALSSSIRLWLDDLGIVAAAHRPVHVQVTDCQTERVNWRDRKEAARFGFYATFVTNAILPDGIGLGQHVSEGFGETRLSAQP